MSREVRYIQHIVQNYGRLAEVTYFLKDSMDKYPIKNLRKLSVTPTEASIALRRGADFVCFRRPDASGYQAAYEWHLRKELWEFRLPEYITADRYASKEVEKDYVPSRLTFCRFLSIHLSFEELNRLGKADYIKVCYGGAFATQGFPVGIPLDPEEEGFDWRLPLPGGAVNPDIDVTDGGRWAETYFVLALTINLGMWFERYVIIISSLSREYVPATWGQYVPSAAELSILVGSFCWFSMFFLLFLKMFPIIAIAEVKELEIHDKEH